MSQLTNVSAKGSTHVGLRWALYVILKLVVSFHVIIKIVENKDDKINHLPQEFQKNIFPSFPLHHREIQPLEVDLF